jgi:hypothetical protein
VSEKPSFNPYNSIFAPMPLQLIQRGCLTVLGVVAQNLLGTLTA